MNIFVTLFRQFVIQMGVESGSSTNQWRYRRSYQAEKPPPATKKTITFIILLLYNASLHLIPAHFRMIMQTRC